jgi:ribosome-associated protein
VSEGDLDIRPGLRIPAGELVEQASRSSGPGGQHVNKASTRVSLRWCVRESSVLTPGQRSRLLRRLGTRLTRTGELVVHADGSRSRSRNREAARARIRELVLAALAVPKARVATKPTRSSRERTLAEKQRRARIKRTRSRTAGDEA